MPFKHQPQSTQIVQAESRAMSRSEAAAARRNIEDMNKTLTAIKHHLVSAPVTTLNATEVAEKFIAVAELQECIDKNRALLMQALPSNTGGKLSDKERQEIKGYYATGNYTQDALAEQYQVSQATIHNVITS
jgi:transcriptional antiterminator